MESLVRLALRIALSALIFVYALPHIGGAQFIGHFWPEGILYGFLLAIVAEVLVFALKATVTLTAGLASVVLVPLLALGFWAVPAVELMILAHFAPANLSFAGWGSAILTGLVFLVVNGLTAGFAGTKANS